MVKLLVICDRGSAQFCAEQAKALCPIQNVEQAQRYITFDIKHEDVPTIVFYLQSAIKVFLISSFDELKTWIIPPFAASSFPHDQEKDKKLGARIHEELGFAVDLSHPKTTVYDIDGHICVDLSGVALEKRQYKIYNSPDALRATIAFHAYWLVHDKDVIVDPFCGSGTIMIEGAHHCYHVSPHYYQKEQFFIYNHPQFCIDESFFAHKQQEKTFWALDKVGKCVDFTKRNAKIAGVHKYINVSKKAVEDLDLKYEDESIDAFVCQPPFSHHLSDAQKKEISEKLLTQAKYLLKKNGKVILILHKDETFDTPLTLIDTHILHMGQLPLYLKIFKK